MFYWEDNISSWPSFNADEDWDEQWEVEDDSEIEDFLPEELFEI